MVDQPAKKVSLLQIGRLTPRTEARLKEKFAVACLREQADKETFLAGEGARFRAVVTSGGEKVSADLISALPALQVIGTRGVGYDHIDLVAAKDRGIAVSNTPDVFTDCVADLAFGALIAVARRLAAADRFVATLWPRGSRASGWGSPALGASARRSPGRRVLRTGNGTRNQGLRMREGWVARSHY